MSPRYGRYQVFVFGHELSEATRWWLHQNLGVVDEDVYMALIHLTKMSDLERGIEGCIAELRRQGADFTGNIGTVIAAPGLSVAAAVFPAAIAGVTGSLPSVLNFIQVRGEYVPCPELPIVDLQAYKTSVGRRLRPRLLKPWEPRAQVVLDEVGIS